MLDRIAQAYGRELIEHGVGFKYVAEIVLSGKQVLIGGEESGGIGIPRFLIERDGTLNALLLANVMAEEGKTLGQLVEELQVKYGRHYYGRRDLRLSEEVKQNALRRAAAKPATMGEYRVQRMEDLDGCKFFCEMRRTTATEQKPGCWCAAPARSLCCGFIAKRQLRRRWRKFWTPPSALFRNEEER